VSEEKISALTVLLIIMNKLSESFGSLTGDKRKIIMWTEREGKKEGD